MKKRSLSTGDLARHCQVTPATIVNWIKAGKLDVYSTPGGQYRMEFSKFLDFLKESGFPIPPDLLEGGVQKLLIIEDDSDMVEMLVDATSNMPRNYEIEEASNGYDALITIGNFKPDLVILDIKLPEMDGLELCRRLRSNPETKNTGIIIITGLDSDDDRVRKVKRMGVEGFLYKPFSLNELNALMAKLSLTPSLH